MYVTSYGGFVLLSIDTESILIVDPHSLSPPIVEGSMQLELLAAGEPKSSVTDFESQSSLPEKSLVPVQGRLWNCSKFWVDEVKAPQFITDVINTGYHLPFLAFLLQYVQGIISRPLSIQPLFLKLFRSLLTPAVLFVCLPAPWYVVLFRLWFMLRVNFV